MNIQYFHQRRHLTPVLFGWTREQMDSIKGQIGLGEFHPKGGTTYALELPSNILETAFTNKAADLLITLNFGMARCSNDDNYNKAIGRNIAKGRMKPVLWSIYPVSTDIYNGVMEISRLRLISDQAEIILKRSNDRVFFVEVL